MKLIRAARVYRLDLPAAAVLAEHLAEMAHQGITPSQFSNRGFVAPAGQQEMVLPFCCIRGFAFAVQYDEKIVPAAVTTAEANRRIQAVETEEGYRLSKKRRQRIREETFADLCRQALTRSTVVNCFYNEADRLLIVATASRKLSDTVITLLAQAVGYVKANTIYVSDAKHGLTTRLKAYLNGEGDEPFDGFYVGGTCKLKYPESQSIAVKLEELQNGAEGLLEAMAQGAQVTEIGLATDSVGFRLTQDFVIKGVEFTDQAQIDDEEDAIGAWRQEAEVRTLQFSEAVNRLCDLLGYKEPEPTKEGDLV